MQLLFKVADSNCVQLNPATRGEITPVIATPDLSEEGVDKKFQFREFSENLFKLRQRVSRKVKTKKKKEKNAARKERKATKTLAIVLGNSLSLFFIACGPNLDPGL